MGIHYGRQAMRHAVENGPRRLSPGEYSPQLNTYICGEQISLIIFLAEVACDPNLARPRTVDLIRFALTVTADEYQMAVFAVHEAGCKPTVEQPFVELSGGQKSEGTDQELLGRDTESSSRILSGYGLRYSPELWNYCPVLG